MTTTLDYSAGTGDCYGSTGAGIFSSGSATVYVSTETDSSNQHLRSWFPFAGITLDLNTVIISATLIVTANTTSGSNTTGIIAGCEAADNPGTPVSAADLLGRTRTTAILTTSIGQYVLNTQYSYDITASVQEILNRAGWAYGNTIAAIIDSNDTTPRKRQVYSANSGSNMAILEIVVASFIPRSTGLL